MQILKIAAVFVGTVLGAGFASGQELWVFFARFGISGVWGALLSGGLIALFGGLICYQAKNEQSFDYYTYLGSVFGKHLAGAIYFITQAFMFISFSIMIAGSCELLSSQFNIPKILGGGITLLICYACLANRVSGIAKLNIILSPVMCVGILLVSIFYSFSTEEAWSGIDKIKENYLISACLYMSYNILSSAAVLCVTSKIAKNKKEAAISGILGGAILTVIMLFSVIALNKAGDFVLKAEFPMLLVAQRLFNILIYIYPPLIYMAMLTTAVSSGFCACEVLQRCNLKEKTAAFFVCALAVPMSMVRFSSLIKNCYMLFGVLGILLIGGVLTKSLKK